MAADATLKRGLSLTLLTLYGLGTTIGAGIYALVGKVAGSAGLYAPAAFLLAALLAGFSAFSFAELSVRFPVSAGEARYVREGLRSPAFGLLVGLLVVAAGLLSAAAVANGFAGYVHEFTGIPTALSLAGFVVGLGLLAAWGIGQSALVAGLITLIEVGGLLAVVWVGRENLVAPPPELAAVLPPFEAATWIGILGGTYLAFFAFIGFEDMVNVAEEVKDVSRTLPRAIIATLLLTLVLYMAVTLVAVRSLPIAELAASEAPLALVYERAGGDAAVLVGLVAVAATANGALIQIVMASRVLYGLAAQRQLPAVLARVHPRTRTPLIATGLVVAAVLLLAEGFDLGGLAEATSLIALTVFTLVNLALWRLKRREPASLQRRTGHLTVPIWVPVTGFLVSAGFALGGLYRFAIG